MQDTGTAPQVEDWGTNPEADQAAKQRRYDIGQYIVSHWGQCPDCSDLLVEVEQQGGGRVWTDANQSYDHFLIDSEGQLCATTAYRFGSSVVEHDCFTHAMENALAAYEATKDFQTAAEWDRYTRRKDRVRAHDRVSYGDVPDPRGGARAAGS